MLVAAKLQADLMAVFSAMGSMRSGDGNKRFSQGISDAVHDFAETGTINTVDAGTIPAGVYVAKGIGSIAVESSVCEPIIYAACVAMGSEAFRNRTDGDDYLAEQIAAGIQAMIDAGIVTTNVTGTATNQSTGATSVVSGQAKGKHNCQKPPLEADIKRIFKSMGSMRNGGGDEYFARELSLAVDKYLKAGITNTNGIAVIVGDVGTGNMS